MGNRPRKWALKEAQMKVIETEKQALQPIKPKKERQQQSLRMI